jgi:hypothetical protein
VNTVTSRVQPRAWSANGSSNGNDGTKNVYGIRERHGKPSGGQRSNYAFQYASNNITLTPDKVADMTVACVSTANPLPDCGSGSKTVSGWIGGDMTLNDTSRSVLGLTVEVTFTVFNPFQVQRNQERFGLHPVEADVRGIGDPSIARAVDLGAGHRGQDAFLETVAKSGQPRRLRVQVRHGL